ncbi:Afadin and alpha-actinin-binding-domain-containing protein [Diaporthe sp. PMI_573]|nr:Afadin and alpha-actinin-binding-domain-containing protein [Diaporthaceae sp. PMI_573]
MIDSENLRTASLYINNQLLCRGLLRDGRPIDFADPGYNDHDIADTMGQIMGVVNDLILRRDRDAEHREALSTTLRSVRADSLRQTDNLSRLHDRYTEAERKIALHDAEETALRSQLKSAEATIQKLKEEAARAKKLVAETRAACANEVRKRDRQIDALKKAVTDAGRARGERKGNTITTIQVAGDIGASDMNAGASTMDEGYNLRHETNGFLAQLAKGLSEENETLLSLIRKTGDSLKDMSGWDKEDVAGKKSDNHAVVLATSPEDMANDMTCVLEHVRALLTNPSFVPMEEVVVREEEIFRLRNGWEKMETRWRDAVHLIDGWRRRMAAGGHPVDMEELKMGLRLSPVRLQNMEKMAENDPFQLSTLQEEEEEEEEQGQAEDDDDDEGEVEYGEEEEEMDFKHAEPPSLEGSLHLVPAPGYEDMAPEYEGAQDDGDESDAASSIFQDDVEDIDMEELQASEPNIEIFQHSTGLPDDTHSIALPPPPKITPLEETAMSGNRKPSARLTEKSRKRSSELMRDTSTDSAKAPPPPPPHRVKEGESPQKRLKVSADGQSDKPKSRPNSAIFTDPGSSLDTPESSVSTKASTKTTVKSTRSDVSAKKDTPTQSKPSTRVTRAAQAQEKKDTPTRALTRQKSTRAIAATNASSARSAATRQETTKARAPPAPASSRAEMPPPPRPSKSTPNNDKSLRPPPPQNDEKKPSPREKQKPAPIATSARTESESSSSAKRPLPESPTRSSPGKAGSRLPLPRNAAPPPQQSPLTMARIAAKLAASEREADAARVRAKLRAARLNTGGSASTLAPSGSTSTVASSRVPSGGSAADAGGDPTKKDRAVSGESAAMGMSGSGASFSTDENGLRGGVSVLGGNARDGDNGGDRSEDDEDCKTVVPSSSSARKGGGPAPPTSPRKNGSGATSPTKASAAAAAAAAPSPAKPAARKREVRSRAAKAANRRRSTLSPWELQSLIAGEVVRPTPGLPGSAAQQGEGE